MSRNFKCFLFALFGLAALCCCLPPSQFRRESWSEVLFSGWLKHIVDLVTKYDIDWFLIAVTLGLFAITIVFVQGIGSWLRGRTSWRWRHSFAIAGLAFAFVVAGIAVVNVTHHAGALATLDDRYVDANARPVIKHNNMKQMALGLFVHQDEKKTLPSGGTFDSHGRGLHGWQTMILPYIEQERLHQQIDISQPWTTPQNRPAFATYVPEFGHTLSEKHNDDGYALTSYAGNIHVLGAIPMRYDAITDGAANTILIGEVVQNLRPWGMPMNCRDPAVGLQHPEGFGTQDKRRGVAVMMADCTVRWLAKDTDPAVLKAISTPRGGEDANLHEIPE